MENERHYEEKRERIIQIPREEKTKVRVENKNRVCCIFNSMIFNISITWGKTDHEAGKTGRDQLWRVSEARALEVWFH